MRWVLFGMKGEKLAPPAPPHRQEAQFIKILMLVCRDFIIIEHLANIFIQIELLSDWKISMHMAKTNIKMIQLNDLNFMTIRQFSSHKRTWEYTLNYTEFFQLKLNDAVELWSIFHKAAQIVALTAQYNCWTPLNFLLCCLNSTLVYIQYKIVDLLQLTAEFDG